MNSELAKRQTLVQGRVQRLEQLAQARRTRLTDLQKQDQHLQEQAHTYEQQWMALSLQVTAFEATGQTEERDYFPLKARQLAADWEIRQRKARLGKNAMRHQDILSKCEGYCRELRQVLRRQEDLAAQARDMYETSSRKGPDHDAVEGGTGQSRNVGERSVFWQELPALWVATFAALFPAEWVGDNDGKRGVDGIVCIQQSGAGA